MISLDEFNKAAFDALEKCKEKPSALYVHPVVWKTLQDAWSTIALIFFSKVLGWSIPIKKEAALSSDVLGYFSLSSSQVLVLAPQAPSEKVPADFCLWELR